MVVQTTTVAPTIDVRKGARCSSIAAALAIISIVPMVVACSKSASDSPPQGRSWAEIAKLPDWSGVWEFDFWTGTKSETPAKLTPPTDAKSKTFVAARARGENLQSAVANCIPPGLLGIMAQPYPIEFLFTPGKVTIAIETHSQMRRIFTDGRPHPDDPDPAWHGHSIGRWEGDTLVADTVALDPMVPLDDQTGLLGVGLSQKAHVVERIRMVDDGHLRITTTVDDPENFLEPWTFVRTYLRHRDWDLRDYICEQNNHDGADSQGRPTFEVQ
jgi:hypothetical protein